MYKILLIGATAMIMTGCATTSAVKIDCHQPNWYELGVADGNMGRYAYEISRHKKTCPSLSLDIARWESGRQEGLKSYCTKANAFSLGQNGRDFNQVCPEEGLLELQQSYALGYQQYYQRMRLYDSWYAPSIWTRPFGFYRYW